MIFRKGNYGGVIDRDRVRDIFDEYVSGYDVSDPKIKLKIDHTYRVAGLCDRIAGSIDADRDFAWLCGMLHDVGRGVHQLRELLGRKVKNVDQMSHACPPIQLSSAGLSRKARSRRTSSGLI